MAARALSSLFSPSMMVASLVGIPARPSSSRNPRCRSRAVWICERSPRNAMRR